MLDIDWSIHIHSDSVILVGKPVVKETRLSVVFILELLPKAGLRSKYSNTIQH